MTLPTGTIGMSQIQAEYGGANPIGLSEYRSKGNNNGSNPISMSQFRGTSAVAAATLTIAVSPQVSAVWGYWKDVVNGGIYAHGSLVPDTFKGVLCECILENTNSLLEIIFSGNRPKNFFTSVRFVGPGLDVTRLTADAGFYYDEQWNRSDWSWPNSHTISGVGTSGTIYFA